MNTLGGFDTLGDAIAHSWEKAAHADDAFAEIAASALQHSGLLESTSLRDITDWFMTADELPRQQHRPGFAQPALRVYQDRGFYIELLFWIDTPTAIHEHSFAGAFGVLRGSSFHTEYRFCATRQIEGDGLAIGTLEFKAAELLRRGDIRPIHSGHAFIHSLLHLEPPSITVVIRTVPRQTGPELEYFKPGLAVDPFYLQQPALTQLALLETLQRSQPELFMEIAIELIAERALFVAYRLIESVSRLAGEGAMLRELLDRLAKRDAGFAATLELALHEERRATSLRNNLKTVTDEEQRFLLALLLSAPDRTVIDAMLRSRFRGTDPETKVLELMRALTAGKTMFKFDKLTLRLLQFAMRGASFDAVQSAFIARFGARNEALGTVRSLWETLHSEPALSPLLPARVPASGSYGRR